MATIDVDGFFKSRRGVGSHFADWSVLENKFKESIYFTWVDSSSNATDDKGVKFTISLTRRREG